MSDDIRGMTAELAADPTSLVFLRLGEALRRSGRLEAAAKVAVQGLTRYPNLPEAHDLYARILVDQSNLEGAFDEWDMTLRLDPSHGGAHKGLAFLFWQADDLSSALRHLNAAAADLPGDVQVLTALAKVQSRLATEASTQPGSENGDVSPPRPLAVAETEALPIRFEVESASLSPPPSPSGAVDDLLSDDGLLLVDAAGQRLLGTLSRAGEGLADQVAAELAGVSREADRAARLLDLGEWKSIALETAGGNFIVTPPSPGTLLLLMRDPSMPMGRVAIGASRALEAARKWLEAGA